MTGFSKFFTPPFARAEREMFFDCLGLGLLDYVALEMSGRLILRARQCVGAETESLLSNGFGEDPRTKVLVLRHPVHVLDILANHPQLSLWEEIFPYPFNQIGRAFSLNSPSVLLAPEAWRSDLEMLWNAMVEFEAAISHREVTCLWVKGHATEMPVLFHFVRRKRVRVGTDSHLLSLSEKYRSGALNPRSLEEHFGTRTAFLYLDLSQKPANLTVREVADSFLALIETAVKRDSEAASALELGL